MTRKVVLPLHGKDYHILKLLNDVARIGINRKAWTVDDVARVARTYLPPTREALALQKEIDLARAVRERAEEAEREVEVLRAKLEALRPAGPPARVLALTPKRGRIVAEMVTGTDRRTIAERVGMTPQAVANHISFIVSATGARDRADAIVRIRTGLVAVASKVTWRKSA